MMRIRSFIAAGVLLLAVLRSSPTFGHPPQAPAAAAPAAAPAPPDCLDDIVREIQRTLALENEREALGGASRAIRRWPVYVCRFASEEIKARLMAQAEENRLDKQPGTTSGSSGSTSLVSKGSSPSLLGFALEHGGLTQTTDGNTITFRGNVANSIRALANGTYFGSYQLKEDDRLVQGLAKLSFGVSFDTGSSQTTNSSGFSPSAGNFSGFSAKYEIINRRDPRDKHYRADWTAIALDPAKTVAQQIGSLDDAITVTHQAEYEQWFAEVSQKLQALRNLPQPLTDVQIRPVVEEAADSLHKKLWTFADVKARFDGLTTAMSALLEAEDKTVERIRSTPLVTVEYNYSRQLTTPVDGLSGTQPSEKIPSLSNINLVLEKGISGGSTPEFTLNAGATLFNSNSAVTPTRGRLRDYRVSAELDVPLREIANVGRPVISLSGQFLSLREEPLGQQVTLNGVTVTRTGNMGVFQSKLSIPIKNSGVKIPISFTYATRTELVKEHEVRGNIGITFDLDSLFAKSK